MKTIHTQRGTTLLEALIAFLVLSLGMLAAARVQTQLRTNADLTRERTAAVRLAQRDIEQLRASAYADIADATTVIDDAVRYTLERRIAAANHARSAAVTVRWSGRDGTAQSVVLHTLIAESDPAYAGALAIAPVAFGAPGAYGRSARIPLPAKDLGDGRSALKPIEEGTLALVFDNASGRVLARCSGVAPAKWTRNLTAADLNGCADTSGVLLAGSVRFAALGAPADPGAANDSPLPLAINVMLTGTPGTSAPQCSAEAKKTVRYSGASGLHIEAVPLAAAPESLGLPAWTDTGDRHVAYHCVVFPPANGSWSGSATIVPQGWTLGAGTGDRRICRYSADLDESGAIDANIEHPPAYANANHALAHQNFLVVRGDASCPSASPVHLDGAAGDVIVDLSTAAHPPS
jgi:type II secretory pathway pseudopilin PulG